MPARVRVLRRKRSKRPRPDTCESGSAGRTLFMASQAQQSAIEGYHNHGVFTYALLEGLAKAGSGGNVQLFDLADYVENRVPS